MSRGCFGQLFFAFHDPRTAGNGRQPSRGHFPPRAIFFSHHLDHFGSWSDKRDLRGFANFGKIGVLGKESVTGVNGVHIGDFRCADHLGNIEIAFAAARRANAHRFVRKAHMQRIAVSLRIHRYRGDAQLFAGADNPQGDFPAIRD